ncbi:MAG: glycoside hydrolase [Cyanobium sp.]|nr:MAG: glycoside hydrolase [Cyanobium sp.]
MNITQITIGRFHHFHLARQFEKQNLLDVVYTGYPRFKLKDEDGIPAEKIKTYPWLLAPYMARGKLGLDRWNWLNNQWAWYAHETLDHHVKRHLKKPTILLSLSGTGLHSGRRAQMLGGLHICDRGSSHIRFQDQLLHEEYRRYGKVWRGIDHRCIAKEEAEYEQADLISVPSQFCFDSFTSQGVPELKLFKIPYGARLERFWPCEDPESHDDKFRVLFVGCAGPRKGFIDLLDAFQRLNHPRKSLTLVGSQTSEAISMLGTVDQSSIEIVGNVPNGELRRYYSRASVFVLPSIEEGLAMVIGEALACGCPVIASTNTGASELISNGVEGFIVPIRSPQLIADRLQQLSDQPQLREQMARAALARVISLGGWDSYGQKWSSLIHSIQAASDLST